jgi:Bacterial Ig domain/Dockerin type I domain
LVQGIIFRMTVVAKAWAFFLATAFVAFFLVFVVAPDSLFARNINEYKDTISDSSPLAPSNHTMSFKIGTSVSPGGYIEITPPAGFETLSTTTFAAERNVELYVDGVPRDSGTVLSASDDLVEIFAGTPGMIRYTLNTTSGLTAGQNLELRIGNHTSESLDFSQTFSTTTGTTTVYADEPPIVNDSTTGTKKVRLEVYDGGLVADASFSISLVERVGIAPIDTTEEIPPYRFNGAPTSTVTGVTLSVELFLETDELAVCKYSTVAGTAYGSMTSTFTGTGLIYHTVVVSVTPDSVQSFYVRCIDDEGNFNIDDYLIQFSVSATPTGESNTDGNVDGDGTGTGNNGGGDGGGGGGETGESDGVAPTEGGTSGGGGSGGGGGGGSGGDSGSTAGGGFESSDAPYRSGDGRVIISGYAFPRSTVYAIVDGNAVTNVKADSQGSYSVTIDEIARGAYTFGVYAIDSAQNKSTTFSTSFTVIGARTSSLSNINLSPTVKASPDPVTPGTLLTLSGYSVPNATITIENEKDKSSASKQSLTATSDSNGSWSTTINTSGFSVGTYKVRVKGEQAGGVSTNFSNYTMYGVGQTAVKQINADLNRDGKVNLTDFSILLFWWGTNGGASDPSADINGDSKVNLTDFSILLFNWTG